MTNNQVNVKICSFYTGFTLIFDENHNFSHTFQFLNILIATKKFSHLWQNVIPKLVFLCEYLWLIKTKFTGLFFPQISMTYAIIINISICMWNPSVVSWLGENGSVYVKDMVNTSVLVLCVFWCYL